jgi:hypothetical protein
MFPFQATNGLPWWVLVARVIKVLLICLKNNLLRAKIKKHSIMKGTF